MNVFKNTSFDCEKIDSNRLYNSFQKKNNKITYKNESNQKEDSSSIYTNLDEHLFFAFS